MASQVFALGVPDGMTASIRELQWFSQSGNLGQIDDAFVAAAGEAYLTVFSFRGDNDRIELRTRSTPSGDSFGSVAGPELTEAWEGWAMAVTLAAGTLSITFVGPNHTDASRQDPSEPYSWNISSQSSEIDTFFTAYNALSQSDKNATTLTLDDGVEAATTVQASWNAVTADTGGTALPTGTDVDYPVEDTAGLSETEETEGEHEYEYADGLTPGSLYTFRVKAEASGYRDSAQASKTITIPGGVVNEAPVFADATHGETPAIALTEDVQIVLSATDESVSTLVFTLVTTERKRAGTSLFVNETGASITGNVLTVPTSSASPATADGDVWRFDIDCTDNGGLVDDAIITLNVTATMVANVAPVWSDIPDQTVQVGGSAITVDLSDYVTDSDGTISTYTATETDANISITRSGAVVTVTAVSIGSATVSVTATDDDGDSTASSFDVTVTPPDAVAPTLAVSANDVDEGGTRQVSVTPSGGSYDTISYAYSVSSGGGSISSTGLYTAPAVTANTTVTISVTGTASGTGTNAKNGTSATVTQTTTLTVRNVVANRAPVWSAIPQVSLLPGASATVNLATYASDPDNDSLMYSLESGGGGSGANEISATLSGSLLTLSVGANVVPSADLFFYRVRVSDGSLMADTFGSLLVLQPNRAPVWADIPSQRFPSGESVTVNLASYASDPDGDAITYSIVGSAEDEGISWTLAGSVLTITADNTSRFDFESVRPRVRASDGSLSTDYYLSVEVGDNYPPFLSAIPVALRTFSSTAATGDTLSINVYSYVSDDFDDDDELRYRITITGNTGSFSVTFDEPTLTVELLAAADPSDRITVNIRATDTYGRREDNDYDFVWNEITTLNPDGISYDLLESGWEQIISNVEYFLSASAANTQIRFVSVTSPSQISAEIGNSAREITLSNVSGQVDDTFTIVIEVTDGIETVAFNAEINIVSDSRTVIETMTVGEVTTYDLASTFAAYFAYYRDEYDVDFGNVDFILVEYLGNRLNVTFDTMTDSLQVTAIGPAHGVNVVEPLGVSITSSVLGTITLPLLIHIDPA